MSAAFAKAEEILRKKGARALAGACLNYQAKRLCGGLSIRDLPDLPCAMDFRDEWESEWSAGPELWGRVYFMRETTRRIPIP